LPEPKPLCRNNAQPLSPALLAKIHSIALDSLVEMASWRRPGHAYFSRIVLARIAGLPEDRIRDLAWNGPVETIIDAAVLP
jgi:hypothetical protein